MATPNTTSSCGRSSRHAGPASSAESGSNRCRRKKALSVPCACRERGGGRGGGNREGQRREGSMRQQEHSCMYVCRSVCLFLFVQHSWSRSDSLLKGGVQARESANQNHVVAPPREKREHSDENRVGMERTEATQCEEENKRATTCQNY